MSWGWNDSHTLETDFVLVFSFVKFNYKYFIYSLECMLGFILVSNSTILKVKKHTVGYSFPGPTTVYASFLQL